MSLVCRVIPCLDVAAGRVVKGVNFENLRDPKRDMLWVAAAGPAANLAMALGWAALFKAADLAPENYFSHPLRLMAGAGMEVNLVLMLLNLLPILPLDGGRILASLLPARLAWGYAKLEPWGFPILLLLLLTSALGLILAPMLDFSFRVLGTVFQI